MNRPWIDTSLCLPEMGVYVVIHHTRGTWKDDDQDGCECVVACRRDNVNKDWQGYKWEWNQFGPDCFEPESVDRWMLIPRLDGSRS